MFPCLLLGQAGRSSWKGTLPFQSQAEDQRRVSAFGELAQAAECREQQMRTPCPLKLGEREQQDAFGVNA